MLHGVASGALGIYAILAFGQALWATATGLAGLATLIFAAGLEHSRRWRFDSANTEDRSEELLLIERARRHLAHIVDQVPTPLIARSPDGEMAMVNRAARQTFGRDSPSTTLDPLRVALDAPKTGEAPVVVLGPGRGRAYGLAVSEIGVGSSSHALIALSDMDAQLQTRELVTMKNTLEVISHEIMNSLTPITSLAQTSAELIDDGEWAALGPIIATIQRRSAGLLRFVDGYRALARLPEPAIVRTSLAAFIDDVVLLANANINVSSTWLKVDAIPDCCVELDVDLVTQAILNLLKNAAEAIESYIVSRPEHIPSIRIDVIPVEERRIGIRVADNGPGLGSTSLDSLIRPFVTTKLGSAGVGLTLASQIMHLHGSEMVFSTPGLEGTGLAVTLPFKLAA